MADSPTKTVDDAHSQHATHEIPSLARAPKGVLEDDALDPVYAAKARVLNKAIQDIGMGKYQVPFPHLSSPIPRQINAPSHPPSGSSS